MNAIAVTAIEPLSLTDRYVKLLAFSLCGYALLGKGFAYAGLAPLFIGEVVLVLGLLAFLRTGSAIATITTVPTMLLLAMMIWVMARTVPYIGRYGIASLRDSVIIMYGCFAFIVIALLLEEPRRLQAVVRYFGILATLSMLIAPAYLLTVLLEDKLPVWPTEGARMLNLRAGEASVHIAGAAVFALLGFRKVRWPWATILVISIIIVSSQSRGGMLAIFIPIIFAALVSGKLHRAVNFVLAAIPLIAVAYVLDVQIDMPRDSRNVEVRQIVDNLGSVFSDENDQLEGTKEFRLRWWQSIIDYTFNGPYFWTGKGFGVNLAIADGFLVGEEFGGPPLRSPHNGQMTILARAGVPGIVLWTLLLLSWYATLMRDLFDAWRRGLQDWKNFYVLLIAYTSAIVIDASFDVALEGPMLGIWFWCLFGLGVGTSMIYRYHIGLRPEALPLTAMPLPRRR